LHVTLHFGGAPRPVPKTIRRRENSLLSTPLGMPPSYPSLFCSPLLFSSDLFAPSSFPSLKRHADSQFRVFLLLDLVIFALGFHFFFFTPFDFLSNRQTATSGGTPAPGPSPFPHLSNWLWGPSFFSFLLPSFPIFSCFEVFARRTTSIARNTFFFPWVSRKFSVRRGLLSPFALPFRGESLAR